MNNPFLDAAAAAVREAGRMLVDATGAAHAVDEDHDHDIKLRLDKECQEAITRVLLSRFPGHTVFGEEGGTPLGASEHQWIVDPIDGTVNFFYGFPHFCSTVALRRGETTLVAATFDPVRGELFTAVAGEPARLNGQPIHVSRRDRLRDAIVATGFAKSKEAVVAGVKRVEFYGLNARKVRMNGSAALDLAYVACGRLDAYIERGVRLWDIAAGTLLIECAGGRVDAQPLEGEEHAFAVLACGGRIDFPVR